jgi:hypothetical protein
VERAHRDKDLERLSELTHNLPRARSTLRKSPEQKWRLITAGDILVHSKGGGY